MRFSESTVNLSACPESLIFPAKYIPLSGGAARVVLGRAPSTRQLCHPTNGFFSYDTNSDDLPISPTHAELWLESGKVYVRDTGSHNGTYVNGVRIDTPAVLSTGDIVTLGVAGKGRRPVMMKVTIL